MASRKTSPLSPKAGQRGQQLQTPGGAATGEQYCGLTSPTGLTQCGPAPAKVAGAGPWAHPVPPHSGLVRGQTEESMEEVHPRRCAPYLTHKEEDCRHDCCKEPEFGSIPAEVGQCQHGCGARG